MTPKSDIQPSLYLLFFVFLKKLPISRHAHKNRLITQSWLLTIGVDTTTSSPYIRLPTASDAGNVKRLPINVNIVSTREVMLI